MNPRFAALALIAGTAGAAAAPHLYEFGPPNSALWPGFIAITPDDLLVRPRRRLAGSRPASHRPDPGLPHAGREPLPRHHRAATDLDQRDHRGRHSRSRARHLPHPGRTRRLRGRRDLRHQRSRAAQPVFRFHDRHRGAHRARAVRGAVSFPRDPAAHARRRRRRAHPHVHSPQPVGRQRRPRLDRRRCRPRAARDPHALRGVDLPPAAGGVGEMAGGVRPRTRSRGHTSARRRPGARFHGVCAADARMRLPRHAPAARRSRPRDPPLQPARRGQRRQLRCPPAPRSARRHRHSGRDRTGGRGQRRGAPGALHARPTQLHRAAPLPPRARRAGALHPRRSALRREHALLAHGARPGRYARRRLPWQHHHRRPRGFRRGPGPPARAADRPPRRPREALRHLLPPPAGPRRRGDRRGLARVLPPQGRPRACRPGRARHPQRRAQPRRARRRRTGQLRLRLGPARRQTRVVGEAPVHRSRGARNPHRQRLRETRRRALWLPLARGAGPTRGVRSRTHRVGADGRGRAGAPGLAGVPVLPGRRAQHRGGRGEIHGQGAARREDRRGPHLRHG
jgi:hypothetical protein